MIAITFALPAESGDFLRRLAEKSRSERNGVRIITGKMAGRQIEVLHTGVGVSVCRQSIAKFLGATGSVAAGGKVRRFDYLISAGFAGALNDEIEIGDLFVAENFSAASLRERALMLRGAPMRRGHLLTVDEIIDSSEERRRLALDSGAAAVDMETEAIARACAERGIPLLSLRVITDTPRQPFPAPRSVLFNLGKQRVDLAKLTAFFLARPHRLPRLVRFAGNIGRAKRTLADTLVRALQAL